ncbi:sensor histidine kinase [Chitinophagaceae bacterium MMS25-I14]
MLLLVLPGMLRAQMSDHLYNQLPPELKPANQQSPTQFEIRRIFAFIDRFASHDDTAGVRELDTLAARLEREPAANLDAKISNLICLGNYRVIFRNIGSREGEWVPYDKQVIKLAGNDPAFFTRVSAAHIQISHYYTNAGQYETALEECFTALDYSKRTNDSPSISAIYGSVTEIYANLSLYKQALEYDEMSRQYLSSVDVANGRTEINRIDNYGVRAELFLDWYHLEKKKAFADSALAYIRKIPLTGEHAGWWQELYHYNMGKYYFEMQDYPLALSEMGLSLAFEDYYKDLHDTKELIRNICLLKTGRAKQAIDSIVNNPDLNKDPALAVTAYDALYQHAKENNDAVAALNFYQLAREYKDSAAILLHRGKVLEVSQKYDVKQKQSEINMLSLKNTAQTKARNSILVGVTSVIFLLLTIVAMLYGLGKRRKIRSLKMKQALEEEQQKVEIFLDRQEQKINEAKENAVTAQRKKVSQDLNNGLSSTLAALRYYINDLQQYGADEKERNTLKDIEQKVNGIYTQAQEYMHSLYKGNDTPVADLPAFLDELSERFSSTRGFRVKLQADTDQLAMELDIFQQTQLYFIIKEAITNTMKHAQATQITISVLITGDICSFSIGDNGIGMGKEKEKGLGMDSMANRVEQLHGQYRVESGAAGTYITGSFPLDQMAA